MVSPDFDDAAHGKSVDGIATRDRQDALAVAHDDVHGVTHNPEPDLLDGAHRIEIIDAGEFGQGRMVTSASRTS
ncbi:MAG: hypothetical protein L0H63_14875 [Nitrococcus sp.]|nr:hypothetical protein [Nitrococcus sp.]